MNHRLVEVEGGRIHLAEEGSGPLVLLVHGFPESWYSWRHQLPALAAAGFRAVAIDVRGYGRSSKPPEVEAYRMLAHVSDNVGVVRALGEERAAIAGHDWGSPIAANSALLRPDVFERVALLSVPYTPRGGPRPTSIFARAGGEEEFYVSYFQAVGRAEAEIEPDVRGWLRGLYAALSGEHHVNVFTVPAGGRMRDRFPDAAWLPEDDLDVYAGEFERTGFFGALARYRNVDRDWEDLAAWDGAPIRQPSLFLGGEHDATRGWLARVIEEQAATMPGLTGSHTIAGAGHWVQQERPDEVNRLLVEWLRAR
ncbi:alpha/beta fold hydrolase [Candidatus Solirubrobacter pratensis]|uniref:alpha/beta fold hydrolase n=1 Tax=Candidatus Solirubrobacter pratensis TaxID=1298857 RepID=UPI00041E2DE6|nr:alpha/beta hydrolase [Candidatus Solirubrobacter pratensis]